MKKLSLHSLLLISLLLLTTHALSAQADQAKNIVGKDLSYKIGQQSFTGYLAYDAAQDGKRPAVLVVHARMGIDQFTKDRVEELAKAGYIAFAVDMYGADRRPETVEEARKLTAEVAGNAQLIKQRFNAALNVLKRQPQAQSSETAAIGYCFGGGIVLNMARIGTSVRGVVSFHGSLNTGIESGRSIRPSVLAFQGDGDPAAPQRVREPFEKEFSNKASGFQFVLYPNLPAHNFTDPNSRTYYEAEAMDAWKQSMAFLNKIFTRR